MNLLKHAAVVAVVWIFVGFLLPVVALWRPMDAALRPDAVNAGPRDQAVVYRALRIGRASPGLSVAAGTVELHPEGGQRLTGTESLARIRSGSARLIVDGGEFNYALSAPPAANPAPANAAPANATPPAPTAAATPTAPPPEAPDEEAPLLQALSSMGFEAITLNRSALGIELPGGRRERLTQASGEILHNRRRGTLTGKLEGLWRGQKAKVELSIGLQAGEKTASAAGRFPLRVRIETAIATIAFEGTAGGPGEGGDLAGSLDVTVRDLRRMARLLDAPWGDGPGLKTASLKGDVHWEGPTIAIPSVVLTIDGNVGRGALNIGLGNRAQPLFAGTLDVANLDLTPYCCDTGHHLPDLAGFLSSWSVLPRELASAIGSHFDADVRLSAQRIKLGRLQFGQSAASIGLKDGKLNAKIAEFEHGGGQGSAEIIADIAGPTPRVSIKTRLAGAEFGTAAQALLGSPLLQGRGNLTAELSTQGSDRMEMLQGLRGQLNIDMPQGARLGLDLKALETAAAGAGAEGPGWLGAERGTTTFEVLKAGFEFEAGVARCRGVEGFAGDREWTAIGALNPVARRIDLVLRSNRVMASGSPPQVGANSVRETSLAGSWSQPKVRPGGVSGGPRAAFPFDVLMDFR